MKQENDTFSGSETKKQFLKTGIKVLFTLLVVSMFALALAHAVKAEDDREYNERGDSEPSEKESANEISESEHEDDDWDFSDDFEEKEIPVVVPTVTKAPVDDVEEVERVIVEDIPVEELQIEDIILNETFNKTWNQTLNTTPINITIPELNLSAYDDSDNDGVVDKYDQYEGEDDKLYTDSDEDGIIDANDKYPGKNDLDYNDSDHDGIPDSRDDNKNNESNKSFWIRLLSWLGLFKEAQ